jgi:hypothetical protein
MERKLKYQKLCVGYSVKHDFGLQYSVSIFNHKLINPQKNKLMKNYILLVVAAVMFLPSFAQLKINDVTLPATFKTGETNLVLNGGGVRKKAFFKVYVAGLYLTQKSKNAEAIINEDKPLVVRIAITSSLVSSDNMSESIREGFAKSMKGNTASLQSKIDEFIATFKKEAIKTGDVYDLVYTPGVGVKAYKNSKLQVTIEGLEFKKALIGIWLSADPVDADLKTGLLGS